MLLDLALLFFVLLGSKLLLGCVAVYMLIPHDATCTVCDAETLPLEHPRGSHRLLRLLRLQRRWCMECRRESLARRMPLRAGDVQAPLPVAEPRLR
ncbi:MAG TPA: hypothetical protein VFZ69_07100 [Longimicrobiales bacterium]